MSHQNDTKKCSSCQQVKPLSSFYKRSENKYRSHCIECLSLKREEKKKHLIINTPDYKSCGSCGIAKPHNEFHRNATVKDGLSAICKECKSKYDESKSDVKSKRRLSYKSNSYEYRHNWYKQNKLLKRFYTAKRRALIKKATPLWADIQAIKNFYMACKEGYEVDHIIPIVSDYVCGLHVVDNFQYLTRQENIKKGNKFNEIL